MTVDYPDIKPILAAKEQRRQALAALSWEEKVAIVDRMRRLLPRRQWHKPEPAHEAGTGEVASDDSSSATISTSTGGSMLRT